MGKFVASTSLCSLVNFSVRQGFSKSMLNGMALNSLLHAANSGLPADFSARYFRNSADTMNSLWCVESIYLTRFTFLIFRPSRDGTRLHGEPAAFLRQDISQHRQITDHPVANQWRAKPKILDVSCAGLNSK
jgi:hypothetical protein